MAQRRFDGLEEANEDEAALDRAGLSGCDRGGLLFVLPTCIKKSPVTLLGACGRFFFNSYCPAKNTYRATANTAITHISQCTSTFWVLSLPNALRAPFKITKATTPIEIPFAIE
ncbi:hypothetical protein C7459_11397 [Tumebacillus permanentifrigoris]|uniref:Uncharacterized protein n=1 Tax=Tumebacillus permanentifrigoris TaxID=378543 RepID=A0A316D7V5_9BACL|nr:hypothetical protein C7459_11397 [Tumebacillus permanentifrigoris]